MKAIFKKTAVIAVSVSLILLLALSVMPMAFAADEAAQNNTWATEAGDVELGERLSAMNISLSGQITMKFYFEDLTDAHSYVKVTVPQQKGEDKELTFSKASLNKDGERYVVSVPVAAAQQTDLVTLQWFNAAGEGAKIRQYSVKYYADKVIELAKTDDKYVDMSQTAKSMLNYGAMAQTIFGYKTENLANAGLYTEANNPINNMVVADLYGAKANVIKNKDIFKGVQMFLQDDVSMRIYVNGDSATVNGKAVSVKEDENGSYVSIYNIPATKFADVFTVAVTAGDKTATAEISVLGWCLDTLASYRLDPAKEAGLKNVAKSLYMYYTWTKGYADDAHIPGTAECIHDRTHTEGNTVICSDCGFAFANSMRLGLTADTVKLEAGVPTDVTFTLGVTGEVDIKALVVTLVTDSDNLTLEYVEGSAVYGDASGNIQGETGLNIVVDTNTPITEACTLATVTYTVTASKAGTYKIATAIQEALDGEGNDIADSFAGIRVLIEATADISKCTHGVKYEINDNGQHRAYCDECRVLGEWVAHTMTDKPFTFPTNKAEGYHAHKACECGKLWDTEGNEIDSITTIAKLNPTVNAYIGYDLLKGASVGGAAGSKFQVSANTDRSYVRYETTGKASDGNIQFISGGKAVTGQYLVIKYRTNHHHSIQVWANTEANNAGDGNKANYYDSFIANGKWHIKVIDLAAKLPAYVQPNENGEYIIQWARIDILDATTEEAGKYFDIGFVAYTDDLSKVASAFLEGDEKLCPHATAADAVWTLDPNDIMFEKTDCLICGKAERYITSTPDGNVIFTPGTFKDRIPSYGNGTFGIVKDENGMPYFNITLNTSVTGEQHVFLYNNTANPVTNIGKYVAVLYRTSITDNRIEVVADSTLDQVKQGVCNFGTDTARTDKWTFKVSAYGAYGSEANASNGWYNGQKFTAFRFDYFNPGNAANYVAGESTDIAFVAYFDDLEQAYSFYSQYVKTYGLDEDCQHFDETTKWNSAQKHYEITCNGCGKTSTRDTIYKTEAITDAASIGSKDSFLTATTVTEGGETFVRYTPTKSTGDPYFYPIRYNTHVTGQFMVIKYRVTNAGKNMSTDKGALFASSAAHGRTTAAGKDGDSSNLCLTDTTLYADGNWHYIIVAPNVSANTTFTANTDGTYTWAHLRMKLINFAAFDGSCYFDIAEIAFTDNEDAAFNYAGINKTYYVAHFDALKIDKTSMSSIPANTTNTFMTKDMSNETLTSAKSISAGGWFVTPGGVKSYKIRVIKVDGVAVTDPKLVGGVKSENCGAADGVTKVGTGKGWAVTCGLNARYTAANIDLSAYEGQTVEFEIVAITNFGEEAIVARFTNVKVPAAQAE